MYEKDFSTFYAFYCCLEVKLLKIYHVYRRLCRQSERQDREEDHMASTSWVEGRATKTKGYKNKLIWLCQTWNHILHLIMNSDINSLAPGWFECNFRWVIFMFVLVTDGRGVSCEIALMWMSVHLVDDNSALVQVMAWCRQATSHYLSQCLTQIHVIIWHH